MAERILELRLLDKEKLMLDMTNLGFEPDSLEKFQRNIGKPYGMVLVTGPTGSGKTNTLYSALQSLNTVDTNIMTAEDPVEFNLVGVNQVQINQRAGLTFAAALRSILRSDPDVLLVGLDGDAQAALHAAKRVIALAPACGVIVYGRAATMDLLSQAMAAGARRYLPFPFDAATLRTAVGEVYEQVKPLADSARLALPVNTLVPADGMVVSPHLLGSSEVIMGIGMSYMLMTML